VTSTLTHSPLGHEALDDPATAPALVERMLTDIARSNRWFGGRHTMRVGLARLIEPGDRGRTLTLLDIGTGAGDLPHDAVRWAAARGVTLVPIGLERIPAAARLARDGGLPTLLGCAGALPVRRAGVDIVLVSQMLHHLDAKSGVRLLAECHAIARRGVVIADLRPSPLAALGYRLAGPVMGVHAMTIRDGVTSLQRGLAPAVLERRVHEATGRAVPVTQHLGARVLAAWRTDR
jgi:ubiquinone/menaquinone biosynthesis C-methylase UbiE